MDRPTGGFPPIVICNDDKKIKFREISIIKKPSINFDKKS
jgi:hypothetical protein